MHAIQAGTWGPPKEAKKENIDDIFEKKPVSVNPQPSTITPLSRHREGGGEREKTERERSLLTINR
jgi:hypothetical protein